MLRGTLIGDSAYEGARAEARHFVAHFIRPNGLERPATPMFVDAIERLVALPAPRPAPAPAWRFLVQPILLSAAVPAGIVGWFTQPHPFKPVRRQLEKRAYRVRKTSGRVTALVSRRARWSKKTFVRHWEKSVLKPLRAARRWTP